MGNLGLLLCLAVCISALPSEAAQELTTPSSGIEALCNFCPRHRKSATLVPSFTKTTMSHRTTPPTTTHPVNHTTTHHTTTHHTTTHMTNHTTTHRTTPPTTTHPANHTTTHRTTIHRTTTHPANHTTTHRTTIHRNTTHPANHTTTHCTTTHHTTTHMTNHTTTHRTTPPTTTHPANHTTTHRTTPPTTTHPANHTTTHRTTPPTTTHPANHTMTHRTTPPATTHPANHTTTPTANHTTPHTTPHLSTVTPTSSPAAAVGDYQVHNGSEVCLWVEAALQVWVQYKNVSKVELWGVFSVQPNYTTVSGNCSEDTATLGLSFHQGFLRFTFVKNKTQNNVYLSEVQANLSLQFPGAPECRVSVHTTNLQEFEARLGHSYRCQNRSLALGPALRLDALHEQVQAFALRGGAFGEAELCPEDRHSSLVPIIIGVVLLVLILIIIIAYLLGRRRTRGGYQIL